MEARDCIHEVKVGRPPVETVDMKEKLLVSIVTWNCLASTDIVVYYFTPRESLPLLYSRGSTGNRSITSEVKRWLWTNPGLN